MRKLSFHQLVWYFFIYSIIGMFLENIFCFITSGIIESRKGFIIGPFCPIYGVGAIILSICLKRNNKKDLIKIFLLGCLIGSSFEYFSSFAMQAIYGIKYWDYNHLIGNINGRTSIMYALGWGMLSIVLIYLINPIMDRFIKKFKLKSLDYIIAGFMIINCLATYYSINNYVKRAKIEYYNNEIQDSLIMSNDVMKYIYPNMTLTIDDYTQIKIRELL